MFSKATAPQIVIVTLDFHPELYGGDEFSFPCKRSTRKQKDTQDQGSAIDATTNGVDWLAAMLVWPPTGFPDFPFTDEQKTKVLGDPIAAGEMGASIQERLATIPAYKEIFDSTPTDERPLADRVRHYFLDPVRLELLDMAEDCKERYYRIVLPTFRFRRFENCLQILARLREQGA